MNSKFTDLVLLVGTNPLPVYVVSAFFLLEDYRPEKLENIWFIFTDQTENYKYNIERLLSKKFSEQFQKIKGEDFFKSIRLDSKDSATQIRDRLTERLSELQNKSNRKVHLNYTGGTKAMGVHSYLAINKLFGDNAEFSYLSADNFKINLETFNNPKVITIPQNLYDLREYISLNLEDIMALHSLERASDDQLFEGVINNEYLTDLIENDNLDEFFNKDDGYHSNLFRLDNGKLIEKQRQLSELYPKGNKIKLPSKVASFFDCMPDHLKLVKDDCSINYELTNKQVKEAVKFIDGIWLEHYLFNNLDKHIDKNKVKIDSGRKISNTNWGTSFELDILLLFGYQFIGISVTTSKDTKICKSKGFEILQRSKQLGGDEAKSILITLLDNDKAEELNNQLHSYQNSGTSSSQNKTDILVLSSSYLKEKDLINKLNEFTPGVFK